MKRDKILFVFVSTLVLILSGCTRDVVSTMTSLPISAERFNGGEKAYIEGFYACWENGDQIHISKSSNGGSSYSNHDGVISLSYSNSTPVSSASAPDFSTGTGDIVTVAYPQSLFQTTLGESFDVSLPDEYEYLISNGKQYIKAPMIGRVRIVEFEEGQENPNVLKLHNICCLLKVQLDRPTSGAYVVDKIAVVNGTGGVAMSGGGFVTFPLSSATPTLTMYTPIGSRDRVTLDLTRNAVAINETKYFYIPIPPQPAGQTLTIAIHNQISGNWMYRNITTNAPVPGNYIATVPGPSTDEPSSPYTFYDYLANPNGGSYINLNVSPRNGFKMEMTFECLQPSGSQYYSGTNWPGNTIWFSISGSYMNDYINASFCGNAVNSGSIRRTTNQKYRVTQNILADANGKYYGSSTFEKLNSSGEHTEIIQDTSAHVEGGIPDTVTCKIHVFGYNPSRLNPGMKLYQYRIWNEEGRLIRNFVPAKRNEDNAQGVYDMVEGIFIEGTGSFTVGND